jgi:glycine cleavage system aminomethyltransferase T
VLAAGAIERPLVFGGNDRPGVMMGGAVRTYLNRFKVTPGRRIALFTSCDDGWSTRAALARAQVEVAAIIDARNDVRPELLAEALRANTPVMLGAQVLRSQGSSSVNGVAVRDARGRNVRIAADILAISGGWNPNTALSTHLGSRPRWSEVLSAFVPGDLPPCMSVVGAAAGEFSLAGALNAGTAAGREAARSLGFEVRGTLEWQVDTEQAGANPLWIGSASRGKAFVDFQHDVTREDIALAAREGFKSAEHLKRYTTLGMATDQGKTSALNGHAIIAALTQRQTADLGTIASRPPYTPVAIGALAGGYRGRDFKPVRLTAGHAWAQARGAKFVEVGDWMRAQWFPLAGEADWLTSVVREVNAVRTAVGVCDVSTLGKIDVQGPDAAAFLDRIYANLISTLPVGRVRYGLMLREDGIVMDDGTVGRLDEDHYLVSTTTANAAKVMQHLEHARQVLWPALDVQVASVSEQWAQYAISGPRSRQLLERLLGNALDVSNAAFPYLACAETCWQGRPARLFRISFSGELAYELAVPARQGEAALQAILAAGDDLGVMPYGTEALGVMRIEKGHAAGNELNGTTTAADLGLGKLLSKKKDFIGRVLAARPGLNAPDRPVLVGVIPVNRVTRLYAGAHFLSIGAQPTLENDAGFLSSVAFSPTLHTWIGLGFLSRGAARAAECIRCHDPVRGADVEVRVTSPCFYDPDGERLKS